MKNSGVNHLIPKTLFHYTTFEKFKAILHHGTLRFKLSTQSNDILDTVHFVDLIKKVSLDNPEMNNIKNKLYNLLLGYFKRDNYNSPYNSYIACFTSKADSRLLWDAYTINRPPNNKCEYGKDKYCYNEIPEYNGVCIAFNRDKINELLDYIKRIKVCENWYMSPIFYTEKEHLTTLDLLTRRAIDIYEEISNDQDQTQSKVPSINYSYTLDFDGYKTKPREIRIDLKKSFVEAMNSFIYSIEATSPFIKHEFWREENEYRVSLFRHINDKNKLETIKTDGKSEFIDLNIKSEMINYVILGPNFSDKNKDILMSDKDAILNLKSIKLIESIGTGIIQMK